MRQSWCYPVVGDWFSSHSRVVQDLPHSTAIDTPDIHDDRLRRVREALRQDALIRELSRRVGSVPGGSSIPRIVREQRWSPLYRIPSTPVSDWLIFAIANFPAINFNGGIGRSWRRSDDWVDVVAHSNAVVGHHGGTRSLGVVETAGISRPSLAEPKSSCWRKVVDSTHVWQCWKRFSSPRRGDRRSLRENNRTKFSRVLHATRQDHDEIPPLPIWISSTTWISRSYSQSESQCCRVPRTFSEGGGTVSGSRWRSATGQKEKAMSWQKNARGSSSLETKSMREENSSSGQVAGIVGVSEEFRSHWNTEEAVCQERVGTKRHGSPGARAEGPGLTSEAGTGRFHWFPKTRRL